MTATKTARTARPATKAAASAAAPAEVVAPVQAPVEPAKKSHRRLVQDAMAFWQNENQKPLTLVAHLSGTATAGSVWSVKDEAGTTKRAQFTPKAGALVLTGFQEAGAGHSTKAQVAADVAKLGKYDVLQHSTGSVWTVVDEAGKQFSYDRKANTLVEKPAKKVTATETAAK